jgi:hypothetical protein
VATWLPDLVKVDFDIHWNVEGKGIVMPGDKRDADDWSESEFGLGSEIIDPIRRATRDLTPHEFGMEIAALPRTFDHSMPDRPDVSETPVPRLLPGEEESDRG